MWHKGSLKVYDCCFHYWVKTYLTGSEWGIDGGKISKLTVKCNGEIVVNYDRGWDIEPASDVAKLALDIIIHEYNS